LQGFCNADPVRKDYGKSGSTGAWLKTQGSGTSRGHFPSDAAASKLIWLALRNITEDWWRASNNWKSAMNPFAMLYEERLTQPTHGTAK
jgi:hypothetical protein